ncbi:MAG: hypothetical protein OXG55_00885 [bacterium]|nr:hypothetical protein [bacterium]
MSASYPFFVDAQVAGALRRLIRIATVDARSRRDEHPPAAVRCWPTHSSSG